MGGLYGYSDFSRTQPHAFDEGFSKFQNECLNSRNIEPSERESLYKYVIIFRVKTGSITHKRLMDIDKNKDSEYGYIITTDSPEKGDIRLFPKVSSDDLEEYPVH